jgi:hypothetical protein
MSRTFRVFVASPGDVASERRNLARIIGEVNQTHGGALGYSLDLLRWETHVAPGAGRPQQVINDQIGSYDLFIGMMWRRFGTPTGIAGSGTEEEYRIAYHAWQQNPQMPLMFYFCQKPFMPRRIEEIDQVRQVLLFRQELEGKALVWDYANPRAFQDDIRKHLCLRMTRLIEEEKGKFRHRAVPDDGTIHIFQKLWERMTPDLKKAFSVAYNENRRAGDSGIQTRDLFAALLRVSSKELEPITEEIPSPALPAPTSGSVTEQPYIVLERPWLSHCVASSIRRLSQHLPAGRALSAADIFADIAKNGSGESVRLLRENKVGPAEIDRILRNKNIDVVATV